MLLEWTNETRCIGELNPWEYNPRQIKQDSGARLVDSREQFGQVDTIAIEPDNTIVNGHQRYFTWKQKYGDDFVIDVRVSSRKLTHDERRKLTIYMHEGATGEWDFDGLANLYDVEELGEWGFPEWKIDEFMPVDEPEPEDAEPQISRAEELREQWGVELGQLWRLPSRVEGQEHRLICGDCTDAAVVEKVMGGEMIDMCATSPPYSDLRTYEIGEFDWDELMRGFATAVFEKMAKKSSIIVNLGQKHTDGAVDFYWNDWLDYCTELGHPLFGMYVWSKNTALPGDWNGRPMPAHEFIFHFKNGQIQANKWIKTKTENARAHVHTFRQKTGEVKNATSPDKIGQAYRIPYDVFEAAVQHPTVTADNEHPARFSEDFVGQLIKTWSNDRQSIYDPFVGSGTTIIAAENLSRQCRAIEISPAYVAVSLQRYVDAFGIEPEMIG